MVMEDYSYLISIALILLSTKVLGLFSKVVRLPQVVGALLAGIILGPACLGIVHSTEMLSNLSEIGVIVLILLAQKILMLLIQPKTQKNEGTGYRTAGRHLPQ